MTIDVKCLSFSYRRRPVLQNTTFSAHSGEIICLLGRNGAGKSTLFRCVLGLLQGYHGQINIDGREIRQMSQHERAVRMAYIPQSNAPLFGHSVFHMVLMGRTAHLGPSGKPARRDEQIALDIKVIGKKELEITFTYQDEYQKAIQLIQLAEQTSQRKVG